MRTVLLICLLLLFVTASGQPPKREFRAAWIATVKNIDWPSVPGLDTEQQKDEYRELLDYLLLNNLNAVIVQIRPSADAFYLSELEPWSLYLTGERGEAPSPYYDPLTFMVDEAHDRGMEFHAWLNPYRALVDLEDSLPDSTSLLARKAEWFVTYGTRMYFDPGIPGARAHVVAVVKDVVSRYDIDAIHFDDYFYPYRIAGQEFPDSTSFANYGQSYTSETKDEWRRDNVNETIKALSDTIKQTKPWVKFGISPFAVWRNKEDDARGSETRAGQTNYDDLFADVLMWMEKGWVDYMLPQLYWRRDHSLIPFESTIQWWCEQPFDGHLYIGHGAYKFEDPNSNEAWKNPYEIVEQIRILREYDKIQGGAMFSAQPFYQNPIGSTDVLRKELYSYPALVPTMPWLDDVPPEVPSDLTVKKEGKYGNLLSWSSTDSTAKYFLIYRFRKWQKPDLDNPENIVAKIRSNSAFYLDKNVGKGRRYKYAVSALDRFHNESNCVMVIP